jgi:hypothetical protein
MKLGADARADKHGSCLPEIGEPHVCRWVEGILP